MANRVLDVGKSIPSGSLVGRLYGGDGPALVISVSDLVGSIAASGAFLTPGMAPLIVVSAGTGISVSHSGTTYTVNLASTATHTILANTTAGSAAPIATTLTAPAAGLTISYGVGNITYALGNDLAALEGLSSTGIAVRTATDTWAQRTITGTAGNVTVTNGDGVAGNPTLTIDAAYVGQSSITTLGTITSGVWNGTAIANANLANSSVTVGSTNIALGATAATISGMTVSGGTLTGVTAIPNGQIGSAGALLLGSTQPITVSGIGVPVFQYLRTDSLPAGWFNFEAGGATVGARQVYGRSRGTVTTAGAVASGDYLALFQFFGDDGSTNSTLTTQAARLDVVVDGTVATGIIPGRFVFSTMNTGGTFAERMRLSSAGGLTVGDTTDAGAKNIRAAGTITAATGGSALGDQIINNATVCTSTLTKTSNTTLATVTGLSVALAAGKTYMIQGWLSGTSGASGGIKVALVASGGLTATSALFQAFAYNGTTALGNTTVTALGSNIVASTAIYTDIYIEGSITVNVAGTINVQAAQNVSNGTSTTVIAGSTFSCLRVN